MHFVEAKSILSNNNGMNLYRGCTHGCIYCDSRSKVYNMNHEFEDIEVKQNALTLLEKALKSKKKKCMIGSGSMSDPYMPVESKLEYTRKSLELIYKYGFGCTLITKSDLVLRDLDLLIKINKQSKCVVQMTLTTFDDKLCKVLEPNVCTTTRRIEVLKILNKHNIPTIVWLCPLLPYINDTKENIQNILNACIESNVKGILCFGIGLTLREGNREYFYEQLDKYFPSLKNKYIKQYGNSYEITSKNHYELMNYFKNTCRENNIMYNIHEMFEYLSEFPVKNEQLTLF